MLPMHSKIGQEMRVHFERLVSWFGRKQLIPVYIEDNIFNFYFSKEMKPTDEHFDHGPGPNLEMTFDQLKRHVIMSI